MQGNSMMMKNNNFAPLTISIVAAVAILSAALVVLPIQQASAQSTSFTFKQRQSNACSGFAGCSNSGTITFTPVGPPPPPCVARVCD